jgi:hypothetical protein
MELRGDKLLDRIIAFDALPPPDSSEQNLRRAMRYSVGAALLKEFGGGQGLPGQGRSLGSAARSQDSRRATQYTEGE